MASLRKLSRSIAKAQKTGLLFTSKSGRRKFRQFQEQQAAAAAAAQAAIAQDPALATMSDDELAARNLAAAEGNPAS